MRKLRTFARLSMRAKLLVFEAVCFLFGGWIAVRWLPNRWVTPYYGRLHTESPDELDEAQATTAREVSRALRAVSKNLPWNSTCLMDATAAKWMLNRRDVPSTLYVGFKSREEPQAEPEKFPLEGHAWIRCGKRIIVGGPVHPNYKVFSYYGSLTQ